jgi:hypothetical protein
MLFVCHDKEHNEYFSLTKIIKIAIDKYDNISYTSSYEGNCNNC